MKKLLAAAFVFVFCTCIILMFTAATPPMPVLRGQWSTNVPSVASLIGDWSYSNQVAALGTNFVNSSYQGMEELAGTRSLWKQHGWYGDPKLFEWGGSSSFNSNGSAAFVIADGSVVPITVTGVASQTADYLSILDGAGNRIGYFNATNQMWFGTNYFYAAGTVTLDTTFQTVTTIPNRASAYIGMTIYAVFYNATNSGSSIQNAGWRRVGAVNTQVEGASFHAVGDNGGQLQLATTSAGASGINIQIRNSVFSIPNAAFKIYGTINWGN